MWDLSTEMCCFCTRNFHSVFIEIWNSWKWLFILYCSYSSAFLFACFWWVCLGFGVFFCVFKGRNEHHLKAEFLASARAAVLCGEEGGKGHSKTVQFYGRDRQYLLLLASASQKVASHCHQLVWLKKMGNLFRSIVLPPEMCNGWIWLSREILCLQKTTKLEGFCLDCRSRIFKLGSPNFQSWLDNLSLVASLC